MDQELAITIDVTCAPVQVEIAGELDISTAPRLEQALTELIREGRLDIVLDLSKLTFTDSTGLGAMVHALKLTRAKGGDIVLRGLSPQVAKVVELTGLDRIFTVG